MKVIVNGQIIADSKDTIVVENNHYFPPASVVRSLITDSKTSTGCPWKGTASYYNAVVDGKTVKDVAWYYPKPKDAAADIKGYVAFYKNKVQFQD